MMVATDVKCIKSFACLKGWGAPEVKSISKRSGTCTWYSTDTKCVVSNVGVPQTCFKEKSGSSTSYGAMQSSNSSSGSGCSGRGSSSRPWIDEDHHLQKRPRILPHRMATVPKTMARVYSLAMGLSCGALPILFRSPRRWFPPAFCSGVQRWCTPLAHSKSSCNWFTTSTKCMFAAFCAALVRVKSVQSC